MNQTFSIKDSIVSAWNTFKREPWLLIGSTALVGVASIVLNKIMGNGDGFFGLVVFVASLLLMWWLFLGLVRMALILNSGGTPTVSTLFGESWDTLWKYAVASIIACVVTIAGFILLIVPGIIVQVMPSLAVFLVLEKGMMPIEALKESRRLTKGRRLDLFLFFVLALIANIIGALPMGLGLLVTIPVTLLAFIHIYKHIDRTDDLAPVVPVQMPSPAEPVALV